ncbi:MAG: hypothetical protein HRU19_18915 [Pseudobacteriovorax sp.]|nr:hypothetical protein [Pseudobacteriovorax sp.]
MTETHLIIRIPNEKRFHELIEVLTETDAGRLPFTLPYLVDWAGGARCASDHAALLMQAGLDHLKQKFPKAKSPELPHIAATAPSVAIPELPQSIERQVTSSPPEKKPREPTKAAETEPKPITKPKIPEPTPPKPKVDFDISLFQ